MNSQEIQEMNDGLRADQLAAHAVLDRAGVGERGAKLEIRIERLIAMQRRQANALAGVIELWLPTLSGWCDADLERAADAFRSALDKYNSSVRSAAVD